MVQNRKQIQSIVVLFLVVSLVNCENGYNCYDVGCGNRCPNSTYFIRDDLCPEHGSYCCPGVHMNNGFVLCKDIMYEGNCRSYSLHVKSCMNLDAGMNNAASSVNTLGKCIRLYDLANCVGKFQVFSADSLQNYDLTEVDFNDIASSVGRCHDGDLRNI